MAERRVAGPGAEVQSVEASTLSDVARDAVVPGITDLAPGINTEQYREWPPDRNRIGICCSGGGIRSASFSLGALQIFRERGLLREAAYMSAVSGGAYMAIAHTALVGLTLKERATSADELMGDPFESIPPWAPGSPEEKNLRDHSTYLASGTGGKLWMLLNIVYGIARLLVPLAAALYALGFFLGWLYEPWLREALVDNESAKVEVSFHVPLRAMVGTLAAMAAVLGLRHVYQQRRTPSGGLLERYRVTTMNLFNISVLWAVFGLALPHLLLMIDDPPSLLGWVDDVQWLLALEVGGLTVASAFGWLAKRGIFLKLVPILVPLIGPMIVGIPFVFALKIGIEDGPHGWGLFWWGAALLWLLVVWLVLDLVTPSMHMYYRERLSTVFIGRRRIRGGRLEFTEPPWSDSVRLSEMLNSGDPKVRMPRLVVCAAVNVSADVPPGRAAATFTFERFRSGGPLTTYVRTKDIEKAAGTGNLTLPAMMAISGAAVSPSMGKGTRASYRFLMALFNVRLGVWIPNPRRLQEVAAIEAAPDGTTPLSKLVGFVRRKIHRPGMGYIVNEALGINDLRKRYIYVSDGGHWENLGLVELLRRGCVQIICLDASGDKPGRYDTLGEAIALARSELDVEVEIDCSPLSPNADGVSEASHVCGTITYPDGTRGVLVLAKTVLVNGAPLDTLAYAQKDKLFPRHSTGDQLFDDQQFESYRALGAYIGNETLDTLNRIRSANGLGEIEP